MTKEAELAEALEAVSIAAMRQLDNMGRGKEPSPRLAMALHRANELLGFDIAERDGRSSMMRECVAEATSLED